MSAPRPLSVKRGDGRSREDILDAAERLMGARGYAATTISALAAASGLPASSIYWHFGSKSGLLGAVLERGARRFFADAAPGEVGAEVAPRERLALLVARSVASMRTHALFLRLFVFLLLCDDGEGDRTDVVVRVRAEGNRLIARGLQWAYQPWGAQQAQRVADQLADTAQALFDGLFLAVEAGGRPDALGGHVETALHALAEQVRAG